MSPATPQRDAPPSPDADALKAVVRRFLDEAENIHDYPRSYDMGHLKQLASALRRRADACVEAARQSDDDDALAAVSEMRQLARATADAVMPMTHENARPITETAIPMARELAEMVEALYVSPPPLSSPIEGEGIW